jgi:hypothetical protein
MYRRGLLIVTLQIGHECDQNFLGREVTIMNGEVGFCELCVGGVNIITCDVL